MYHIKDDQRSIRSSEMLYNGLSKLMREIPYNNIKVKDLVEVANVGRATFYRNFDDIDDILRLRCDQVFEGLIAYLIEYVQKYGNQSGSILLKPLLRYFYLNSEILELLMTANRLDIVQSSFRRATEPYKTQAMEQFKIESHYADYALTMRIGLLTSILIHWIETGKKEAPDELADKLSDLLTSVITIDQLL